MSHRVHTFRPLALAFSALLAGLLSLAVATPAWAHDELIGSSPAAGAQVDAMPDELTMTFSGVLLDEPGATEVVVTDAAGSSLTDGDPRLDGTRLTQPLSGTASGAVTVIWRVVSSDGHPVSGQYSFTVGTAGAGSETAPSIPAASPSTAVSAEADGGVPVLVWIVLGIAVAAALGALVAVLLRRSAPTPED
ncbi:MULTISPECIES: copper resistance CopC family protein [Microbacterium]|uniref:Copper resistance protein CopC n=1 Tax=Microbacterium hominis TaxID=162426 RepID=A0A2K9DS43_9MICO|nr:MULTISPECIES: copper resistance CopC family protein [Microbacterium]AUG30076.1 copper resistance protein CopC [Microbacterium hominis]